MADEASSSDVSLTDASATAVAGNEGGAATIETKEPDAAAKPTGEQDAVAAVTDILNKLDSEPGEESVPSGDDKGADDVPATEPDKDDKPALAEKPTEVNGEPVSAVLARAEVLGIPREEAESLLAKPALLKRVMDAQAHHLLQQSGISLDQLQKQRDGGDQTQKKEVPTVEENKWVDEAAARLAEKQGLDQESVKAILEEVHGHFANDLNAVKTQLQQYEKTEQEHAARQQCQMFDSWIAGFCKENPEYAELLGDGPTEKLDPDSVQFKTRNSLLLRAGIEHFAYEAFGRTPPSFEEQLKTASTFVFADKQKELLRKSLSNELSKKKGQILPMPSHRKPVNGQTGEQEAIAQVATILARAQ